MTMADDRTQIDRILMAEDLSVHLGSAADAQVLFSGVGLELSAGDLVDLVGPSGSGKTTLLRTLARLHPWATGKLSLDRIPATDITPQVWRTRVALLPQKAAFVEGTIADNLLLPYGLIAWAQTKRPDETQLRSILDDVGLEDIELEHDVERLSMGQSARVALCRTLLTKPEVLLLDEADAALDPVSVERISLLVAGYVRAGRHACIRIRHRESDGHTTRRLVFSDGRLREEACHE